MLSINKAILFCLSIYLPVYLSASISNKLCIPYTYSYIFVLSFIPASIHLFINKKIHWLTLIKSLIDTNQYITMLPSRTHQKLPSWAKCHGEPRGSPEGAFVIWWWLRSPPSAWSLWLVNFSFYFLFRYFLFFLLMDRIFGLRNQMCDS